MEKITMERLTTDLKSVIAQINEIVANKDITSAREVLSQVRDLVANENGIPLDAAVSDVQYDHVLHELLKNISGVIEIVEKKNLDPEIERLTLELAEIDSALNGGPEQTKAELEKRKAKAEKDILKYTERLAMLRSAETKEPLSIKDRNALKKDLEAVRKELEENGNLTAAKKKELELLIAELDAEIEASNNAVKETDVTDFVPEDQAGQADRALQEYAKAHGIDPSELKIVRTEIEDLDDGPKNEFKIVRLEKLNLPILTTVDRSAAEQKLAQAREDLRKNGQKRNDPNVEYEMFRIEHTRLTGLIAELESTLRTDDERRGKNPRIAGILTKIKATELEIAKLEEERKALEAREEELAGKLQEDDLARKDKSSLKGKIKRAEAGLAKAEAAKKDAEEKIANLPKEIDRESLEKRKQAILIEIEKLKALNGKEEITDSLDLGAEAAKIGDAIFKTADIRRELADRQITREDFLAFYEQGKQVAEARLTQIAEENNKVQAEIQSIFADKDSDKTLSEQLEAAIKSNDEAKIIEVTQKLTTNFLAAGAYTDKIEALGIKDGKITSIEDAKKIVNFKNLYEKQARDTLTALKVEADEQKENIGIFDREIKIIRDEIESLKTGKIDDIKAKSANEKALRAEQIRASMFGDEELQAQWDDTFKRFHEHFRDNAKMTYKGKDGQLHEITYQTVEEYEGMEQDALFLNLEDYKFNLEQVSKYRASGGDILALDPKFREGKSEDEIKAQIEDMAEYVSSFHGLTNKHAVKYANLRTAGSTLKAMKPVKGDLPAKQKMANAAENTLRFLGLRIPKFTKIDENGKKVFDPKGLATLAVDALVVGGVAAAGILGGPWGLAGIGVTYAARGAVVLGNKGAAAIEYARFGDEIDKNLPTPYEATKDSREVARKEYYREVEGMGKFTSWVKAKADRLPFFRKRAKETEEAIVEARIALSNATIDGRDEAAIKTVEENAKKAEQNQQRREANYRATARDAFTYNGIVVDPDSVDKDVAAAAIARNAAIRSNGGTRLEDVNPASKAEKKTQYVKPDEELAKTDELGEVKTEGGSIASTAITVEQIYTGEQQRIDRWNKVWTAILTTAGNIGLNALRNGFLTEKTITTKEPDQVVNVEKEVPITEEVTRTELDPSQTISDIKYDAVGRNDVYGGAESATSQIADPDAVAFAIKHDGRTIELSLAEQGSSYTTRHVQELVSFDISKATPEQLFEHFRNTNGNFDKFVEALGLPPNATNAEIAKAALEQNTLYGQSGSMEGWRRMAEGGLKTVTEEMITGTKTVIEQQIIPGNITQTVVSEFDPTLVINAGIDGAVLGAAAGTIDQLHEAIEQTKKTEPGTHEKLTPSLLISKIAQKKQDEINKQRQDREQNGNNKDENNKDDGTR